MQDDFEVAKAAGYAVSDLVQNCCKNVLQGVTRPMQKAWGVMTSDFTKYFEKIYKQNRMIRVVCLGDKDIDLYEIYVPGNFSSQGESVKDEDLIYKVRDGENIVLTGSGGSGKTLFMRHLWLSIFENSGNKIPVFIELRSLNLISNPEIETYIRNTMVSSGDFPEDVFRYFAERGAFCFLFDGIDEVKIEKREEVSSQIVKMSIEYSKSSFFITSRPDNNFAGWAGFEIYKCENFDFRQSKELLSKTPIDKEKRNIFLKQLDKVFFKKYEMFLSNPLLSIIFLVTFSEKMQIPDKVTIFYDDAYNALYSRHDSVKRFSRDKIFDINKFQEIFGVFCLLSYFDEVFEFNETTISKYIEETRRLFGFNNSNEEIIHEFTKTICLMIQDGWSYVFIHRSFQEYFAAKSLITTLYSQIDFLMPKLKLRFYDLILPMAYELDEDKILHSFIMEAYESKIKLSPFRFQNDKPFYILNLLEYRLEMYLTVDPLNDGGCMVSSGSAPIFEAMLVNKMLSGLKFDQEFDGWVTYDKEFMKLAKGLQDKINEFEINRDKLRTIVLEVFFEQDFFDVEFQSNNEIAHNIISEKDIPENIKIEIRRYIKENYDHLSKSCLIISKSLQIKMKELKKICEEKLDQSNNRQKTISEIIEGYLQNTEK